jgi:hypothetical protein
VETEKRPAVFGFQGEILGEKKKLTCGVHMSVREGGKRWYRFGSVSCWAVGFF